MKAWKQEMLAHLKSHLSILLLPLSLKGEVEWLQGVEKVESKAKEEDDQEDGEEYGHLLWNGEVASLGVQQDEPSNPPKQVAEDRCSKESH